MENEKIVKAYDTIQLSDAANARIRNKIKQKQQKKRPALRYIAAAATAAVMIFVLFGIFDINLDSPDNSFAFRAYAMEMQADGSVVFREVDIAEPISSWHGWHDGENYFKSITLLPIGKNIQNVEMRADTGFFAKQYLPEDADVNNPYIPLAIAGEGNILMHGTEFEIIGDTFAFENGGAMNNFLLFLGQQDTDLNLLNQPPQNIDIHVLVTFYDGKVLSETITIRFAEALGMIVIGEGVVEDVFDYEDWRRRINAIPLSELTLIPESVQILVPDEYYRWGYESTYVWERESGTTFVCRNYHLGSKDEYRLGLSRVIRGEVPVDAVRSDMPSDVILSVVILNDHGELIGMDYIVPMHIAREFGF